MPCVAAMRNSSDRTDWIEFCKYSTVDKNAEDERTMEDLEENNDPKYTSTSTIDYLKKRTQSLNLNIDESLWVGLKRARLSEE